MNQSTEKKYAGPRLMRLPAVLDATGISRSGWLRLVKDGHAPAPVKLSPKTTCWVESEVEDYLQKCISAGRVS